MLCYTLLLHCVWEQCVLLVAIFLRGCCTVFATNLLFVKFMRMCAEFGPGAAETQSSIRKHACELESCWACCGMTSWPCSTAECQRCRHSFAQVCCYSVRTSLAHMPTCLHTCLEGCKQFPTGQLPLNLDNLLFLVIPLVLSSQRVPWRVSMQA